MGSNEEGKKFLRSKLSKMSRLEYRLWLYANYAWLRHFIAYGDFFIAVILRIRMINMQNAVLISNHI